MCIGEFHLFEIISFRVIYREMERVQAVCSANDDKLEQEFGIMLKAIKKQYLENIDTIVGQNNQIIQLLEERIEKDKKNMEQAKNERDAAEADKWIWINIVILILSKQWNDEITK